MVSVLGSISALVFLVLLIVSIISAIKKNGKAKKYLVYTGVLFIITGILISLDPTKSEDKTEKKVVTKLKEAKKASTTPKKAETLEDNLKKLADPHFGKITSFIVNEDMGKNDGGKIVLIHVQQEGVTKNTADFNTTNALAKIFKNDKVNEIAYFWDATLVDVKGKERVDTVLKIQMTKDTAKTINWENFSHKNLEIVADQYNISPVLK